MEEFKVFFSFQTDSHLETNFHFLRDILDEVCKSIKHYKVDLDWGFKESTGNRPLTSHMLDQGKKADVFIADMTYTSEFNTHEYQVHKSATAYRKIKKNGKVKMYPNGNVLLETGYSWAVKDYKKTILLMNTAFGHPDNFPLPADLIDIERPFSYELSKEDLSDKDKVDHLKNDLRGSFRKKILEVIELHKSELREEFIPIFHYLDWPGSNYKTPYILDEAVIKDIQKIRPILNQPGAELVIESERKSGRTRFAYELFKKQNSYIKKDSCIGKSFYYDFESSPNGDITKEIFKMKNKKQHFVLILDNCSNDQRNNVNKILEESQISRLFILNPITNEY